MKKVIIATMLMAATWSLSAQVTVYKLESSGTNPAYAIPEHIRMDFQSHYPTITVVNWAPVSEMMWRATYTENNRISQIYYNNTGQAYRVALPVISTHVPEEVVTAAINTYGANLYDITKMKAADNTDVYQVRLLENNMPKSVWMDQNGILVTSDVYKVKVEEDEIKVKTADEKIIIEQEK